MEQALNINPNHQRAAELLSTIYLSQGELDKAQELLERLQEIFPRLARPRLTQIYLQRAAEATDDAERLGWYEQVLKISPSNQEAKEGISRLIVSEGKLSVWNPANHLRLLWWVLVTPANLRGYRLRFGERAERSVGSWLASTLTWLPLLWLTWGTGLCVLWIIVWLLTVLLDRASKYRGGIIAFRAAYVVAFLAALVVLILVRCCVVGELVAIMAVTVATNIAVGVALGVAGDVTFGVTAGMALGIGFDVAILSLMLMAGARLGIAEGAILGGALIMVFHVRKIIKAKIDRGVSAPWALVLLALSHVFLIWFILLGGAQMLNKLFG